MYGVLCEEWCMKESIRFIGVYVLGIYIDDEGSFMKKKEQRAKSRGNW